MIFYGKLLWNQSLTFKGYCIELFSRKLLCNQSFVGRQIVVLEFHSNPKLALARHLQPPSIQAMRPQYEYCFLDIPDIWWETSSLQAMRPQCEYCFLDTSSLQTSEKWDHWILFFRYSYTNYFDLNTQKEHLFNMISCSCHKNRGNDVWWSSQNNWWM